MRAIALRRMTSVHCLNLAILAITPVWAEDLGVIDRGRQLAFDPTKGNCLACHLVEGSESPGDLGPPLVAMEARFPDKQKLRNQLWDPMEENPDSRMPPFGRHRILTEDELDMVVEYIYTL
jgi:sulfur-oxidizing protein SoxX